MSGKLLNDYNEKLINFRTTNVGSKYQQTYYIFCNTSKCDPDFGTIKSSLFNLNYT